MKIVVAAMAFSIALVGAASAEQRYDRKLEEAVKARVAARIGELRAGFGYRQQVYLIRMEEPAADPLSVAVQPPVATQHGWLTLATERAAVRRVF